MPRDGFLSVTRTDHEISVVCRSEVAPDAPRREDGWALLKVEGPLEFGETGILAKIATTLAGAEISIFAISTFDTDYILVKEARVEDAIEALRRSGIEVVE